MKKWFVSMFIFVFGLTIYGFSSADSVTTYGTCADSAGDGYEYCYATFNYGDGKVGGKDDYKLYLKTYWKAVDYNTAYFSSSKYTSSGVDSNNDDYINKHYLSGSSTKFTSTCNGKKIYGISCTNIYGSSLNENTATNTISSVTKIYDPENKVDRYFVNYFKPTR